MIEKDANSQGEEFEGKAKNTNPIDDSVSEKTDYQQGENTYEDCENEGKQKIFKDSSKNKWGIADKINFGMFFLTAGLLIATGYSTCLTREAIVSSDSTNRQYLEEIRRISNSFDTSASTANKGFMLAQKSFDTSVYLNNKSFGLQQKILNSQINSLKETQREFELENRPFVQVSEIKVDTSDYKILISFKIINYGKFPADVLYVKSRIGIPIGMVSSMDENPIGYLKTKTDIYNIYVPSGANYLPELTALRSSSNRAVVGK